MRRRQVTKKVWRKKSVQKIPIPLDLLSLISAHLDPVGFNTLQKFLVDFETKLGATPEEYFIHRELFHKLQDQKAFIKNFREDSKIFYDEYFANGGGYSPLPTAKHGISLEEAPALIILSLQDKLEITGYEIGVIEELNGYGMELTYNLCKVILKLPSRAYGPTEDLPGLLYTAIFENFDGDVLYDLIKDLPIERINNISQNIETISNIILCKLAHVLIKYEENLYLDLINISIIQFYEQIIRIIRYQDCPIDIEVILRINQNIGKILNALPKDPDIVEDYALRRIRMYFENSQR